MEENDEYTEDVKRFEQMDYGKKECYFDVESIENIFDFYAENDQFDKAELALKLGCKLHPNSLPLLFKKTLIMMEKGDENNAIKLLEELLKFEDSNPELYFYLGWLNLKTNNLQNALSYFNEALKIAFYDEEELLVEIVYALNQMEFFDIAIKILETAKVKYPDNEGVMFELAYAYANIDMTEKSLLIYYKMLEKDPFSEDVWNNLGILFYKNDDFKHALECYDYVIAINPKNGEVMFNKGNALLSIGKAPEALDCYIDYFSYGNYDTTVYHYIAECLEQMKLYDLSYRFYEQSVSIEPSFLPSWISYILLLINNKDEKKALKKTTEALLVTEWFPEFIYLRAKAFMISNNYEQALYWMEKCLENEPNFLRNVAEWIMLKKKLCPYINSIEILKEKYKNCPESYALNYACAAIAVIEMNDFNLAGKFLDVALSKAPEEFDKFFAFFEIPENVIFDNTDLFKIIKKYFNT